MLTDYGHHLTRDNEPNSLFETSVYLYLEKLTWRFSSEEASMEQWNQGFRVILHYLQALYCKMTPSSLIWIQGHHHYCMIFLKEDNLQLQSLMDAQGLRKTWGSYIQQFNKIYHSLGRSFRNGTIYIIPPSLQDPVEHHNDQLFRKKVAGESF